MAKLSNKLTATQINHAKPKDKPYKLADGAGLTLLVNPDGTKYWRFRYRHNGKENMLALGVYPHVSLVEARRKLAQEREKLSSGQNPSKIRKMEKLASRVNAHDSFERIAREWYETRKDEYSNIKHAKTVIRSLELYIFPEFGGEPIRSITTAMVIAAIRNIEQRGTLDTAKRTLQRVNNIFIYAVTIGKLENNPASDLYKVLKSGKKSEFAYILAKDLPPFIEKLETHPGEPTTVIAIKLLMLTFVRPGEVRGARWDEFDFAEKIWRIPAERMKRDVEHIVPLSSQTIALLGQLKPLTGSYDLLFPSRSNKSKPMSDATMNRAIRRLGFDFVGHGFRKTASTWLHESGYDSQAIERQLAHNEKNKTKAAYNKAQHLELRKVMMQAWADAIYSLGTI